MVRGLILAAATLVTLSVAHAADLEGVSMPEARVVNGTQMRLNGIGLRTFSVLGVRIYVAGLYLERPNDNAEAIIHSPDTKLLDIRFLRNVDAQDARKAWQESLEQNCRPPCYLDPNDERRFLAAVPSVRSGDASTLLFTARGVHIALNERPLGGILDRQFAELMLATFIGLEPPAPRLRREIPGSRD
jgi:hypothetical protein